MVSRDRELEPGRIVVGLPDTGIVPDLLELGPRKVRVAELFERLLARLD